MGFLVFGAFENSNKTHFSLIVLVVFVVLDERSVGPPWMCRAGVNAGVHRQRLGRVDAGNQGSRKRCGGADDVRASEEEALARYWGPKPANR